jgi:predicted nucleic acid-binding protein
LLVVENKELSGFRLPQDPLDPLAEGVQIRGDLKKRGQMIGANDLFIAAHARSLGLRLVTNNTAEFGRVKGLTLENWTLPVRRSRSRDDQ